MSCSLIAKNTFARSSACNQQFGVDVAMVFLTSFVSSKQPELQPTLSLDSTPFLSSTSVTCCMQMTIIGQYIPSF
jgi:hypothetical protein